MAALLSRVYQLATTLATRTRVFKSCVGRSTLLPLASLAISLLYRMLPNPMHIRGLTLHYNRSERDLYVLALLLDRYEPETTQLFRSLIRPGMTVVDLGAHIGHYSLLAAQALGSHGTVYAFEPQPYNFMLLKKNIEANGYEDTIVPIPKAVARSSGTLELFVGKSNSRGASKYRTRHVGKSSVKVDTVSLDSFFSEIGWPAVHLIKMDVEGAEEEVLKGMKELSRRNPEQKLIMEFAPENLRAANVSPGELFGALQGLGFRRFFIIPDLPGQPEPLNVPDGLPHLTARCADSNADLLCEK